MPTSINQNTEKNKENIDSNIFLSLFEYSISAILYGNPDDGNLLDANQAAAKMFGYTIDELRKLNRNDIFDFEHHSMINSLKMRQANGAASGELIGIRKNGERFPCEFSSSIFKNEKGENRTSTILNDISERKNAEEETLLLLNNTEESFVLLDKELKIISFNKQFEQQYFYLFHRKVAKGDCILDFAQDNRREAVAKIYERVLNGETIEDEIIIPLENNNSIIFSIWYKPALDNNSNIIGAFVTSRNITEKKKAQAQIISNEKRFRSIIEHTGDLITMTDENGNFIYVSPSVERIMGISKEELLNKSYKFTIHPDYIEDSKEAFQKLINNPGLPIDRVTKILHQDGHFIWVEGVVTNLLHDENVKAIVSNYRDISEKIKFNELREFEQRNKEALINNTDDLIWSVSRDFKLLEGNKSVIDYLKKNTGNAFMPGDSLLDAKFFDNDVISFWKELYDKGFRGNSIKQETYSPESEVIAEMWAELTINPIYDSGDIIGIACYSKNITDKKRSELKLKESFELLEKLTFKIPAALYQFEINTEGRMYFPYMSSGIKNINPDLDLELLKTDATPAFSLVHPDDLYKLLMSIEASKNNLTDWEFEYRSIVNKNDIIWTSGKSSPEKKADGTIVWYGYLQDITDQKNYNKKIKESKERYDIISKATNDTIWDVDLISNTIVWNDGIKTIFGYCENEPNINDANWWFTKINRAVAGAMFTFKLSDFFHNIPGPTSKYAGEKK